MSFKAFIGSAFNHSHVNKAFNELHDRLQQHWAEQDEPLYLFGNFFDGGNELDALVVKRNAIIVIDFKNFGGDVQFSVNNRWTCDGVPVKGGVTYRSDFGSSCRPIQGEISSSVPRCPREHPTSDSVG